MPFWNTLRFLRRVASPQCNCVGGAQPLLSCTRLLIQCIRTYQPHFVHPLVTDSLLYSVLSSALLFSQRPQSNLNTKKINSAPLELQGDRPKLAPRTAGTKRLVQFMSGIRIRRSVCLLVSPTLQSLACRTQCLWSHMSYAIQTPVNRMVSK
jgi:hypothetical protein